MSSGFITEKEVEARKQARQAEWEKVRKPEDPLEAPEGPPPDNRSLYDRLQEQKMKKQEEYEEAHKLKNLVKGLDDDEADFLEFVDKTKMDLERQKILEEKKELNEFRSKMAELREQELNKHIKQELGLIKPDKKKTYEDELPSIGTRKTTQSKLLAGVVKRKSTSNVSSDPKKQKIDNDTNSNSKESLDKQSDSKTVSISGPVSGSSSSVISTTSEKARADVDSNYLVHSVPYRGSLVCIGILPGLASYSDSSNSDDNSSDSERGDSIPRDLCGRQIAQTDVEDADAKKKKS